MGISSPCGILPQILRMQLRLRSVIWLAAALLAGWSPANGSAKTYSSGGGHSYSSHSSSSGGSHSFSSGSHSFSSGSSHSSGGGHPGRVGGPTTRGGIWAENKGKTLWEMLCERVRGPGSGNGAGVSFANPLDLRVGSAVPVAYANGPEFASYNFTVHEIREYTRHLQGQDFHFTDYVLNGVNSKSLDAEDNLFPTGNGRVRTVATNRSCFLTGANL